VTENTRIWDVLGERVLKNSQPDPNSGCWLWTGYLHKNGYATLKWNEGRSSTMAHRASYKAFKGPIPEGLVLDHKCKTRCCVNPDHLEPVTYAENNRRSPRLAPLKEFCKNGHPLAQGNLYKSKWRRCAECSRVMALAAYHRNKNLKKDRHV